MVIRRELWRRGDSRTGYHADGCSPLPGECPSGCECWCHGAHAAEERRASVLADVVAERARQDAKWGEQNHSPEWWLAILSEEVGELATAILRQQFVTGEYEHRETQSMRAEAIQVAAVAIAMVEALDRQGERGKEVGGG